MPTYEYRCEACGYEFEKFQPITAKPLTKCPECSRKKVRRLISSGGGILFKGSGFYQTDYRSKSYQESAKKDLPAKDSTCPSNCQKAKDCPIKKENEKTS